MMERSKPRRNISMAGRCTAPCNSPRPTGWEWGDLNLCSIMLYELLDEFPIYLATLQSLGDCWSNSLSLPSSLMLMPGFHHLAIAQRSQWKQAIPGGTQKATWQNSSFNSPLLWPLPQRKALQNIISHGKRFLYGNSILEGFFPKNIQATSTGINSQSAPSHCSLVWIKLNVLSRSRWGAACFQRGKGSVLEALSQRYVLSVWSIKTKIWL